MDWILALKAVILGIIEGLTEFLPISSTGHMILVEKLMTLSSNRAFVSGFEVIIQLGAITAVVVYFWKKLCPFTGNSKDKSDKWLLWGKVLVAVIPSTILGLKFSDVIKSKLFNPTVVAITLIVYGVLLILIEFFHSQKTDYKVTTLFQLTFITAFGIGLFQCLAMVPGTSRSAATIIGAMILGLNRPAAAEFSFYLAIPTMIGASLVTIYQEGVSFLVPEWIAIGIGFFISFVVALWAIRFLMGYIQKHNFKLFGYYRIVLGIIVLSFLAQS